MKEISFSVPGEPVGQGRPRFARRGSFVQAYDPPKSKQYKAKIVQSLQQVYVGEPLSEPLRVEIKAYFGIPKSYSKKRKHACLEGDELPAKKPDT